MRTEQKVIGGRAFPVGTTVIGSGWTVTRVSTGAFDLTFPASFRPYAVTVAPATGGQGRAVDAAPSGQANQWRVTTSVQTTGSLVDDTAWSFVAVGR